MRKLAAVSVDLDGIGEYRGLHGIAERDEGAHAVYDVALARMAAFAHDQAIPLTLFAIGRDLSRDRSAVALRAQARRGHWVENHSHGHRYDLSRCDRATMALEVGEGARAIEVVCDRRPRGFRAPGYLTSRALFEVLAAEGVAFDASRFPCPAYYLAKLGAMARVALAGRESRALWGPTREALGSAEPHRIAGDLWELPMAVTRGLRLPFIGTALTLGGERAARWLARGCVGRSLISLELHAIDFLDARDGLDDLLPHQPDVRVAVSDKLRRLSAAIAVLRAAGYPFVRLADAHDLASARD